MARMIRVFVSSMWERTFPLARVKALERVPSDHNPLLVDTGDNLFFGKKRFRFEKWWLEQESFRGVVEKAWRTPCNAKSHIDAWESKIRS